MTKILKTEEFINEQVVSEMGMRVRNKNIQQKMPDQLKKYNLVYNEATGLYDCDGNVKVEKDLVSPDGKLIIKFGDVGGWFNCRFNKLISLEGAPQKVGGDFNCAGNKLTSLEGAPQEVGGDFDCYNNQLTSLSGAPQEVSEDFYCYGNNLVFDEPHFYGCLPDVIGGELKADDGCDYELAKNYYNQR